MTSREKKISNEGHPTIAGAGPDRVYSMHQGGTIMKRLLIVLVLALGLMLSGFAFAPEAADAGKAQTNCPVMGGKIDRTVFADYQGKRVYFCCTGCVEDFRKDPDKYIRKLESEGVELEKTSDAK